MWRKDKLQEGFDYRSETITHNRAQDEGLFRDNKFSALEITEIS